MSKKTRQVRAWKELMAMVAQVQDPLLRRGMIAEFREKALRDWGWDPVTGNLSTDSEPMELAEWEKEFVQDIQDSITFGFNVRQTIQESETTNARANMFTYVRDGGTLDDIPDNIRTPEVKKLYWECHNMVHEEMMAQVNNVLAQFPQSESGPEPIGDIMPRVMAEIASNIRERNDKTTNY